MPDFISKSRASDGTKTLLCARDAPLRSIFINKSALTLNAVLLSKQFMRFKAVCADCILWQEILRHIDVSFGQFIEIRHNLKLDTDHDCIFFYKYLSNYGLYRKT